MALIVLYSSNTCNLQLLQKSKLFCDAHLLQGTVAQSSLLGPTLLHYIYITNIPSTGNDNSTRIFIHNSDKNVSIQSSSLDTATTKLDHARDLPEFWFPTWGININHTKYTIILYSKQIRDLYECLMT